MPQLWTTCILTSTDPYSMPLSPCFRQNISMSDFRPLNKQVIFDALAAVVLTKSRLSWKAQHFTVKWFVSQVFKQNKYWLNAEHGRLVLPHAQAHEQNHAAEQWVGYSTVQDSLDNNQVRCQHFSGFRRKFWSVLSLFSEKQWQLFFWHAATQHILLPQCAILLHHRSCTSCGCRCTDTRWVL